MKVSIFGLGYVGCVSLGCLAQNGHTVVGVDLNASKVSFINAGKATIIEDEIDGILSAQHKLGRISATNDGASAVRDTDVSIICVGTPPTNNGHLDFTSVYEVAGEIGRGIKEKTEFHVIAIRSTVLPGTNEKVTQIIEQTSGKKSGTDFATVSNPEFLREGTAVRDYYSPPYTLLGTDNARATEIMKQIYASVDAPFIETDIKIAEISKYVNNAFHALKITFANEVGNICKHMGIDSHELMEIFCRDTKLNISPYYLKPGFCYGGSCLPEDLKALRTIAHDLYLESPILENIERSNESQKNNVLTKILAFNKNRIGFLGLSFKPGTDDLRNSPIIDILEKLIGKGFDIKIYDKNVHISKLVGANREYILTRIPYISKFIVDSPIDLLNSSELIVVVNKEDEFSQFLENSCNGKIVYDLARLDFEPQNKPVQYQGIAW